ncbi:unnamed protein product [Caenorhabditis sp. 36 PRJEB53466]|nr:unnamed protein product [Caenorhabditis sp. 36 PRJEB53466]
MPRHFPVFVLFLQIGLANGDLMRTVYCANKCNDYLKVPEASIPKCEDQHLRMNQCGTVISCSWADVELEKQRPVANGTDDIVCCYNVVLKEKGDCDVQQNLLTTSKHTPRIRNSSECLTQTPALFSVIAVLILVVAAQTFYIMWTCAFQRRLYHQKVCQLDESTATHSQAPNFSSRPICESALMNSYSLLFPLLCLLPTLIESCGFGFGGYGLGLGLGCGGGGGGYGGFFGGGGYGLGYGGGYGGYGGGFGGYGLGGYGMGYGGYGSFGGGYGGGCGYSMLGGCFGKKKK